MYWENMVAEFEEASSLKSVIKSWNARCARNREERKGFHCVPCETFAGLAFQLFFPTYSLQKCSIYLQKKKYRSTIAQQVDL
jgi:hypothetical protein